jgi:hypothetical protein
MTPVAYEWDFSDLRVSLRALNFRGPRGVLVSEVVEVPWPVRPDAPSLARAP